MPLKVWEWSMPSKKEAPGEGQANEWVEEDEAPEHGIKEWMKQLQALSM